MLIASYAWGQSIADIYKSGEMVLMPDKSYADGVNWKSVFPDFDLVTNGNPIGRYKSMAVAPDGSVFVGNYSSYSIQKFDSNGKPLFSFGKRGSGDADFKQRPTLGGVVGGKYVFTHEHNGNIKLFTLDGKYAKTIVLDYMPTKAIALNNNNIAVVGHVAMAKINVRYVITIIDPETGEKNIIKKFDDLWEQSGLVINKDGYMWSYTPFGSSKSLIARALPDGNLAVGVTSSDQIEIYSPEGKLVRSFKLDYSALPYPEEMKLQFISRFEKMVDEGKLTKLEIEPIYKEGFFQKRLPFYYNFLVDTDGNILVFRFVDEDVDHKFRVYTFDGTGKNIGDVVLKTNDFKLNLQYRFDELVFHKNKVIALVQPTGNTKEPYHLVRFDVKGK